MQDDKPQKNEDPVDRHDEGGATAQSEVLFAFGGTRKIAGGLVDCGFNFAEDVLRRLRQCRQKAEASKS